LEWLLVTDPKQFTFRLGRKKRRAAFHEPLLDGEEILAWASLPAE
jgi:hypothetical protein